MPSRLGRRFSTADELAARYHCRPKTVKTNYQKWGLKPLRIANRLLFGEDDVVAHEERAQAGEMAPRSRQPRRRIRSSEPNLDE